MIAIGSLLITLTMSLVVTRVGAISLMLTGLSRESARFQARSAFTGVGFTTQESESMVNHPVRRRIIMLLMLLGNVGIAAVVATMMVSFTQTSASQHWGLNAFVLASGVFLLWLTARSRWIERRMNQFISYALRNWAKLDVKDYVAVLQLQDGYAITEMKVDPQDWLADKTLIELKLPDEGVLVLGVQRPEGVYVGAPTATTEIDAGDTLVLYGPIRRIEELDQRRSGRRGDAAHQEAVIQHEEILEEQEELEDQVESQREQSEQTA